MIDYPTSNPTEIENELNYLAIIRSKLYVAYRKGLLEGMSEEEYFMVDAAIQAQADKLINLNY